MKTISKLKYVFFLLVIAGFVSCKGEIGPPGADGVDGTNGVDGTDGSDGADGNANVISSDWIPAAWLPGTATTSANFSYTATDITENIMNTGVFLSYIDLYGDGLYIVPMPFTWGTTNIHSYFYLLTLGNITWRFTAQTADTPPADMKLRYVIIPSSASKSANSKQAIYDKLEEAGVEINNYYEVMDYYGLGY